MAVLRGSDVVAFGALLAVSEANDMAWVGALWTGLRAVMWYCWWGCWVLAGSISLPQCGPDVGINRGA